MPKRKRKLKKRLTGKGRLNDAQRWLSNIPLPEDILTAYSKRYGISQTTAWEELIQIGYHDELTIQSYEKDGKEWEYLVEPLSGEMYVVPKGTQEHELYEIYPEFLC